MDLTILLILIGLIACLDVFTHYFIADRQVKRLRAESARFEAEWQAFLKEIQEAVKGKTA